MYVKARVYSRVIMAWGEPISSCREQQPRSSLFLSLARHLRHLHLMVTQRVHYSIDYGCEQTGVSTLITISEWVRVQSLRSSAVIRSLHPSLPARPRSSLGLSLLPFPYRILPRHNPVSDVGLDCRLLLGNWKKMFPFQQENVFIFEYQKPSFFPIEYYITSSH
jgi:hypothetical protein